MSETLLNTDVQNVNQYSALTLAFIGDGVFDLMVREYFVSLANCPAGVLNEKKVKIVCCKAQAEISKFLLPMLTEKEAEVYKRGRNAHVHAPKNSKLADYHAATGLESLFGYLYLCGDIARIREIFEQIKQNYILKYEQFNLENQDN